MNRTIKKTAMALVIVSLIALLTLSAIFLGALQVGNNTNDNIAAANDNPIEIGNYANVNGYVTTQSTVGTPITTVQELWNFFTSTTVTDTINNKVAGYLANDITINDNAIFLSGNTADGATTRNCRQTLHLPTNMVLDGNGHKIILNNSSDNLGRGYSELKPAWQTPGWDTAVVVQGGLAAWNSGSVKNVNFVINNDDTISRTHGASMVYGGVFGINDGTIDNCSLTLNGAKRFNLYTSAKSSGDTNLASVAVGGMVGIMGGSGKITNTKVDMQKSLILVSGVAVDSAGINNARARGYVGGMVGWMSNASIENATIVGSGDVLSSAVSGGWQTGSGTNSNPHKYDYASYAGGLVGSSGKNGRMVGSGAIGTISGVVSSWNGKTQGTFGGDSDLHKYKPQMVSEWSDQLINGASESYGAYCVRYANGNVLFGAVGDAGAQVGNSWGAATGVSDINFLNVTAPTYIASWNCTNGGAGGSKTPITSNAINVTAPATGNLFVGYPGTATSLLTISYDAPFFDTNGDKIDDFNTFVWSGKVTKTVGQDIKTSDTKNFQDAKSIVDYTLQDKSMTNVTQTYARNTTSATITAEFANGRGVYIGDVGGAGITQEGHSNIYNVAQKTYDKTALALPTLELCYNIEKTRKISVTDTKLWTSYPAGEVGSRVELANAKNAGSWTSEVLQQVAQRPEHILFESTITDAIIGDCNYIAYKADNAIRPKVKQTIAPKAVNATYTVTPGNFTYKGEANTYAATVANGGLIDTDTTDILFSFFELSGAELAVTETPVLEAKDAGKYRIKMSSLSNGNYVLAADNATNFVISPSTVDVTVLNNNLTYNGLSQTPKVDIAYDIATEAAPGANIKIRGIFPVDIGVTYDTIGLQDPSDNTQKNAGQFNLNLAIASGMAQRNYAPLTTVQKKTLFSIDRAECIINTEASQSAAYQGKELHIQYTIEGVNREVLTGLGGVRYERLVAGGGYVPAQPAFAQTYRATISIVGGKGQMAPNYKSNSKEVVFVITPLNATIAYDVTLQATVPYSGANYDYGKTILTGIFKNGADERSCKVYGYQYSKFNAQNGQYEDVKYDDITDLTTPKGVKAVGKYKVTANFNGYGNYIIADKDKVKEFEITVANVNIEAKPVAREFGAPNPDMSAEWTYQTGSAQFFADDAVTLTLATTALQYSDVRTYPITLGAVNGPNAANYNVVMAANTNFTVNKRQAKFDFTIDGMDALNKVIYNGKAAAVKPVITYPTPGYVEDNATKLTYTVVFTQNSASVTTATNVGTYTATITLTAGSNFEISADSVYTKTFDIIPRVVVLQFAYTTDIGLVYGEAAPTFGATDYGFAPDSLTFASEDNVTLTSSSTYKQFGKVGTYTATLTSNADSTNYSVTYPVRNVVVTPKTLGVTVAFNPSLVFNGEAKVATGALVGVVNKDNVSCDITYNALTQAPVNAGVYALAASLANNADGNYVLGALSQKEMTITPAPVTVTFTFPQSMQYDGNVKAPTVALAGLVTADAAAQPILTYSIVGRTLVEVKNAGTYKCVVSLPDAIKGNYTLNITEQDMTVTPIAVNVTLTPPTNVTYDGLEKVVDYELQAGVVLPQEDVQIKLSFMRKGTATAEPVAVDRAIAYGEHTTVVAFGNTNYVVGAGTNACVFTISTATITADVTMPIDFVYSASAKEVKVVLNGIEPNDIGKVIAVVKYNGADSAINVGVYTVEITLGGEAGAQYAFETITKTFTITQKEISVTFAPPANLVYDGAAKVMGVEFVGVQGADIVKYSLKYGEADSAINAGKYVVTATIDDANYKLVGVVTADMAVAKADRTINQADFEAVINYNKIAITNKSAFVVDYNINGGAWQKEAAFVKEIKPLNTFVVNIILKGDSNYNDSNIIVLDNLKTGSNPMWVTAKLDDINAKFGFADIALYLEAVELFGKVAPQDRKAIEAPMANATATYNTFVASVKDIIGNAQHNASLANGKPNSYVRQTAFNFANQNGALVVTFVVAGLALVLAVGAVTLSLNKKKGGNKNEEI